MQALLSSVATGLVKNVALSWVATGQASHGGLSSIRARQEKPAAPTLVTSLKSHDYLFSVVIGLEKNVALSWVVLDQESYDGLFSVLVCFEKPPALS